jgi:hypothetical protein
MKNPHERFGVLEYTKRMKDTTTRIRVRSLLSLSKQQFLNSGFKKSKLLIS